MKHLFILLIITSTISSCTEEIDDNCVELNCDIIGEWVWTKTYGSIAGITWTPESTGNVQRLEIEESNILFFRNDTLINTFPYEVFETDTLYTGGALASYISYNTQIRRYNLENGVLEMNDLCSDCYNDFYEKE